MNKFNYLSFLLSSCTSNLGVVPLFLLWAFLFLPAFVFLFSLLIVVTAVLETIKKPHFKCLKLLNKKSRPRFVLKFKQVVKTSKALILLILYTHIGTCFSKEKTTPLILSRGEHREISATNLINYSIGNPQIVGVKHLKDKNIILLKGLALGRTELILWKKGQKTTYSLFVDSKRNQLKIENLKALLASINLKTQRNGNFWIISGTIQTKNEFKIIHQIKDYLKENGVINVQLEQNLKNLLIAEIYKFFFDKNIDQISCDSKDINILCYLEDNFISKDYISHIKNNYFASIFVSKKRTVEKNFKVRLKLYQLELLTSEKKGLGLDGISGSIDEILISKYKDILGRNKFNFNGQDAEVSVLTDQTIEISLSTLSTFKIGQEIAVKTPLNNTDQYSVDWKFAGLKVDIKLEKHLNKFSIEYTTELSKPSQSNESISGNQQSSKIFIDLNQTLKMFELGLTGLDKETSYFPYLSKIPILGLLFTNNNRTSSFKKIIGIVELKL